MLRKAFLLFFILSGIFFGHLRAEDLDEIRNPFAGLIGSDTVEIKLETAILLALQQNPLVAMQRLDVKVAATVAQEQRAAFDPVLSAATTQSRNKLQRFLGSRPDPFELTTDRKQYDVILSEMLPTGTTISFNASMIASLSSIYSDQYSSNAGVTVTQALLQGFGLGRNLASLRRANLDLEISNAELRAVIEGLVADVEKAYWDLYLAAEEIQIQVRSLDLANQQLQESLERVAVGKLPELELAAVHAEVAIRQEALIDAQSRYEQMRLRFLYLLNPTSPANWSILPLAVDRPFVPTDTLASVASHEQVGIKYRSDLQQARLSLEKGELELAQTKNGLLPKLDLFVNLGRTAYARTFVDAAPDLKSPFYDISVGLSFELPVPNRKARAQLRRSRYTNSKLELSLLNMTRLVQWDVRSAYVEVLRAREQIQATQVTRDLQAKKLAAEQEKFRVGKSTNYLVLQAQRDFIASQLDEARAMVAYLDALVNLYHLEGTLLNRRGIDLS